MLGPIGGLHVEAMAGAVYDRGHEVIVGGPVWPGASYSPPLDQPIPVSVRTWPTARWMRRLLRETRPDVVHAHWMPIAGLALLYGASPLVVSAWGSDVFRASPRERVAWRLVARHADMLMGSSRALVQGLEDLGAPADRTALLNWGVDLGAFAAPTGGRDAARRALGLPPGPMILSPRSDGDVYNADIIVRAFDRVADERDDITLVLLRSPADRLDLGPLRHSGRVRVVGRVPHELMADYYGAADVCVSIASSDSSPRSVWEAMACGCPVVISDLPWVHELIAADRDAIVVPVEAPAVAAGIRRVLSDRALAGDLGRRGRALAVAYRDRAAEMDHLADVYRSLAA